MAKGKTAAQLQNYEKKVTIDSETSGRSVKMVVNHLPLTKEAFNTELKDEFTQLRNLENEYVNIDINTKGEWAFSLSVGKWDYVTGEGYRIEYVVPGEYYEDTGCATYYWNFNEDLDGVIEVFYKVLCEEEDPMMIGMWEKDSDEAEEEEKIDELDHYEYKYEKKFGEEFDKSIFCDDVFRRTETISLCLSKNKTFRDKEILDFIESEIEEYKKIVLNYARERAEGKAKVKALLEG